MGKRKKKKPAATPKVAAPKEKPSVKTEKKPDLNQASADILKYIKQSGLSLKKIIPVIKKCGIEVLNHQRSAGALCAWEKAIDEDQFISLLDGIGLSEDEKRKVVECYITTTRGDVAYQTTKRAGRLEAIKAQFRREGRFQEKKISKYEEATQLFNSAARDNTEIVERILQAHTRGWGNFTDAGLGELNAGQNLGTVVHHYARIVKRKKTPMLDIFFKYGVELNYSHNGVTPARMAVRFYNLLVLEGLIDAGVNVNQACPYTLREEALILLIQEPQESDYLRERVQIYKLLKERGGEINYGKVFRTVIRERAQAREKIEREIREAQTRALQHQKIKTLQKEKCRIRTLKERLMEAGEAIGFGEIQLSLREAKYSLVQYVARYDDLEFLKVLIEEYKLSLNFVFDPPHALIFSLQEKDEAMINYFLAHEETDFDAAVDISNENRTTVTLKQAVLKAGENELRRLFLSSLMQPCFSNLQIKLFREDLGEYVYAALGYDRKQYIGVIEHCRAAQVFVIRQDLDALEKMPAECLHGSVFSPSLFELAFELPNDCKLQRKRKLEVFRALYDRGLKVDNHAFLRALQLNQKKLFQSGELSAILKIISANLPEKSFAKVKIGNLAHSVQWWTGYCVLLNKTDDYARVPEIVASMRKAADTVLKTWEMLAGDDQEHLKELEEVKKLQKKVFTVFDRIDDAEAAFMEMFREPQKESKSSYAFLRERFGEEEAKQMMKRASSPPKEEEVVVEEKEEVEMVASWFGNEIDAHDARIVKIEGDPPNHFLFVDYDTTDLDGEFSALFMDKEKHWKIHDRGPVKGLRKEHPVRIQLPDGTIEQTYYSHELKAPQTDDRILCVQIAGDDPCHQLIIPIWYQKGGLHEKSPALPEKIFVIDCRHPRPVPKGRL